MLRALPIDVLAIRPSSRDPLPYLTTASLLVDTHFAGEEVSAVLLAEIEKWWAAHLMEVAEPSVISKKLGDSSWTMSKAKLGEGLKSTLYGQTVLALDPTGTLAIASTSTLRQAVFDAF